VELSIGSAVSGYESDSDPNDPNDSSNAEEDFECHTETDIDAAVAECQERLRQAALTGGGPLSPTPASARRVSFSTVFLVISSITFAASLEKAPKVDFISLMLAISSGLLLFLLLVVISRQPQRKTTATLSLLGQHPEVARSGQPSAIKNFFQYSLVPCGPAAAILLHAALLVEALDICGLPFAIWLSTGLTLALIHFKIEMRHFVCRTHHLLQLWRFEECRCS